MLPRDKSIYSGSWLAADQSSHYGIYRSSRFSGFTHAWPLINTYENDLVSKMLLKLFREMVKIILVYWKFLFQNASSSWVRENRKKSRRLISLCYCENCIQSRSAFSFCSKESFLRLCSQLITCDLQTYSLSNILFNKIVIH